jgi:hypothetical protein
VSLRRELGGKVLLKIENKNVFCLQLFLGFVNVEWTYEDNLQALIVSLIYSFKKSGKWQVAYAFDFKTFNLVLKNCKDFQCELRNGLEESPRNYKG